MFHCGPGDKNSKWLFAKSTDFVAAPEGGVKEVKVTFDAEDVTDRVMFVLRLGENHWVKDGAKDFEVMLPDDPKVEAAKAEAEAKKKAADEERQKRVVQAASAWDTNVQKYRAQREAREKAADVSFSSFDLQEG